MEIPDSRLIELKALYRAEYGVDLGNEETAELAAVLVRLVEAVYRPEGCQREIAPLGQMGSTI